MNLILNTQWTEVNNRTYLVVEVAAPADTDVTATQTYLDIHMPEGVRIRHIGQLTTDGRGRSIGVDLPDLSAGEQQNIVFKVKVRQELDTTITPELHLHWIDSATGDLMERHQTGALLPTGPIEVDDDLSRIVATARSEHQPTRRESRRRHSMKENEFLTTEEQTSHRRRGRRCTHRNHSAATEGREMSGRAGRHGAAHLHGMIADMRRQIDHLERKVHRMQRQARMEAMNPEDRITRRPRRHDADFFSARPHVGHRMHAEGRRMGRMMRRAAASWHERDERHPGM